jgi:iron(III) transport system ATP-binding protein
LEEARRLAAVTAHAPPRAGESVELVRASKFFRQKAALSGIDLCVPPGTFAVLLGPSGSGKTTLLRCLAGVERLSGGSISISDRVVSAPGLHVPPEQRHLAMVFQDYALWPHMNAESNVAFPLRRAGVPRPEARRRAAAMLERVGLLHLAERYPNELSGGEQQRVALARALVGGVGLVLFDEPLSNLDADMREQLRLQISTLARDSGATTLYITHDQSEAFSLADRVGVLCEGRLVQWGSPEQIYRLPASPFVARFTGVSTELDVELASPPTGPPGRQLAELRLRAPGTGLVTATLPWPVTSGARLTMFVRPTAARIVAPGDGHIVARVRDIAFSGRGYEHALLAEPETLFTKIYSERRFDRGSMVGIRLHPEGCLVLCNDDAPQPGTLDLTTPALAS